MSPARYEDWMLLDLEPGADLAEINAALRLRRALYQPGSLATYNLLDDDERRTMIERIDEAFRRVTGHEPPPANSPPTAEPAAAPKVDEPSGPAPDSRTEPGALLAFYRRSRGMSIEQLSAETKIRVTLLQQLESENIDELPEAVFVRGHVLTYARALGLENPNEIAALYLAKVKLD
ncbi:MAG: helix-turn-helix transcriptional regulator [Thermoanaerobaculales bacterium]|jgi:hypothetical protein|nr:helix-turn-helix transcriptional regulator [Thermoanaerobaculales bacterium]